MLDLEEFQWLLDNGAGLVILDQCMYGASIKKPTVIFYMHCRGDQLARECNHRKGHPKMVGKRNRDGSYKLSSFAAYPKDLNRALADMLADACTPV